MSAYTTQGTTDNPLTQNNARQYSSIQNKSQTGDADLFYYDNNYPLGNIFLWPIPDSSYTLTLYSKKELTQFTALTTDVDLALGMKRMLVYNFALEIAGEYGIEPSLNVRNIANESKKAIINMNSRNNLPVSGLDSALQPKGGFNIYTGEY